MIISLRGTSGSGKSHLVRRVLELYPKHRDVYEPGRRNPLYTIHGRTRDGKCLVTPGHYLIKNGGVDTLPDLDTAYRIARWADTQGHDVLMEGKNMSDGVRHVNDLVAEKRQVHVFVLSTPLAECVASVRKRGHKIAEKSIEKTYCKVQRDITNFHCEVSICDRDRAFEEVRKLLGPHEGEE